MRTRIAATTAVLAALVLPPRLLAATAEPASADSAAEPHLGIEIDSNSRYVWRSIVLSRREVVQPSIWSELWGTTFSVWGNAPVRDPEVRGFDEVDLAASRSVTLAGFELEATSTMYTYPTGGPSSAELQLVGSHGVGAGLTLKALGSVDVVDHPGASFVSGSISRDTPIRKATLSITGRLSHASPRFVTSYISDEPSGLDLVGGSASLEFEAGWFVVRPHLDVDRPFGKHRSLEVEQPPWVFGVAVGGRFAGRR